MPTPTTQKAWVVERMGHPSKALKFHSDWPVPSEIPKGHVLVKIQAAALKPMYVYIYLSILPHDATSQPLYRGYKLMQVAPNFLAKRPLIAEHDFSGVVEQENDTEFNVGDPVFGFVHVCACSFAFIAQFMMISTVLRDSRSPGYEARDLGRVRAGPGDQRGQTPFQYRRD